MPLKWGRARTKRSLRDQSFNYARWPACASSRSCSDASSIAASISSFGRWSRRPRKTLSVSVDLGWA
eukprot:3267519-Alexandrium_andersonii.AAC.1